MFKYTKKYQSENFYRFCFFHYVSLLFLVYLFICLFMSSASADPEIIVTPQIMEAHIGDTITFDYEISGISDFDYLAADSWVGVNPQSSSFQSSDSISLDSLSGSFQFDVKFGYSFHVTLVITDKNGQSFFKESELIDVLDYIPISPTITINPRVTTAHIGDTITFDYEISGISDFDYLAAESWVGVNPQSSSFQSSDSISLDSLSGSFQFDVKFGYSFHVTLVITDKNGQSFFKESELIDVLDYIPISPTITINPRVTTAHIGDTITFDYEISGISDFDYLAAESWVGVNPQSSSFQSSDSISLDSLSGSFQFDIKFGYSFHVTLVITDKNGQSFFKESEPVEILNYQFIIPYATKRIESEAFAQIAAKTVYISSGVEYIAQDAFPSNITIYALKDSYAADWASDNGYLLEIVPE